MSLSKEMMRPSRILAGGNRYVTLLLAINNQLQSKADTKDVKAIRLGVGRSERQYEPINDQYVDCAIK